MTWKYLILLVLVSFWTDCCYEIQKINKFIKPVDITLTMKLLTLKKHRSNILSLKLKIRMKWTYIADGLEKLASEFLEGLLLVLRLSRDDSVKVITKVLCSQTQIILNVRPCLLLYQSLHVKYLLRRFLRPLRRLARPQWLQEEPALQWQV